MGVTGGLVRNIFFRNKSFEAHQLNNNGRSNQSDQKKRWSSVRSYLCGDEFNSVLAVDDSGSIKDSVDTLVTMSQQLGSGFVTPFDSVLAIEDSASVKHLEDEDTTGSVSVKSSEATVTQPLHEETSKVVVDIDNQSETTETHILKKKKKKKKKKHHHQTTPISTKLFIEEDAAVIIQSAFTSYLAIRRNKEDKVSMGTSLQVQTCNSMKARKRVSATIQTNKSQVLRIKEDWDDSTVSSTVSKLRIQSRIEAMTKRERALAYAFSQQLRICSKKKQIDRSSEEDDSNIGWSWLERWMATRVPDISHIETKPNIQTEVAMKNQRLVRKNIYVGIAGELESCASNDIPLQYETISETLEEETKDLQTEKSSFKPSVSKRKPVPSYKTQTRHNNRLQATTKDLQQQKKKAKKAKTTPSSGNIGNECKDDHFTYL